MTHGKIFLLWHGNKERRLLHFFNPEAMESDLQKKEQTETAQEGQKKGTDKKNKLAEDNISDRIGKKIHSLDVKLNDRSDKLARVDKRLDETKAAAAKQRPAGAETSAVVDTRAQSTPKKYVERAETEKERASRKGANDMANAVAGGLAKGLTFGIGESGDAQLRQRSVKQEVVGDSSSTTEDQEKNKKQASAEQPQVQQVAAKTEQPDQKGKAAAERPQAETVVKGEEAKEKKEEAAKATGVAERQSGQAA